MNGIPQDEENIPRGCVTLNNRIYPVFDGLNTIGRHPHAVVNIKSLNVSHQHAVITVVNDNSHYISDIKSSNGTVVDNKQLIPLKLYHLRNGSSIKFGDVHCTYKKLDIGADKLSLRPSELSQSVGDNFYDLATQTVDVRDATNSTFTEMVTQIIPFNELQTQVHSDDVPGNSFNSNGEEEAPLSQVKPVRTGGKKPVIDSDSDTDAEESALKPEVRVDSEATKGTNSEQQSTEELEASNYQKLVEKMNEQECTTTAENELTINDKVDEKTLQNDVVPSTSVDIDHCYTDKDTESLRIEENANALTEELQFPVIKEEEEKKTDERPLNLTEDDIFAMPTQQWTTEKNSTNDNANNEIYIQPTQQLDVDSGSTKTKSRDTDDFYMLPTQQLKDPQPSTSKDISEMVTQVMPLNVNDLPTQVYSFDDDNSSRESIDFMTMGKVSESQMIGVGGETPPEEKEEEAPLSQIKPVATSVKKSVIESDSDTDVEEFSSKTGRRKSKYHISDDSETDAEDTEEKKSENSVSDTNSGPSSSAMESLKLVETQPESNNGSAEDHRYCKDNETIQPLDVDSGSTSISKKTQSASKEESCDDAKIDTEIDSDSTSTCKEPRLSTSKSEEPQPSTSRGESCEDSKTDAFTCKEPQLSTSKAEDVALQRLDVDSSLISKSEEALKSCEDSKIDASTCKEPQSSTSKAEDVALQRLDVDSSLTSKSEEPLQSCEDSKIDASTSKVEDGFLKPTMSKVFRSPQQLNKSRDKEEDDLDFLPPTQAMEILYSDNKIEENVKKPKVEDDLEMLFSSQTATQQLVDVLEKSRDEDVVEDSLVEPIMDSQAVVSILSEGIEAGVENKRGPRKRKMIGEGNQDKTAKVTKKESKEEKDAKQPTQMSTRTRRKRKEKEDIQTETEEREPHPSTSKDQDIFLKPVMLKLNKPDNKEDDDLLPPTQALEILHKDDKSEKSAENPKVEHELEMLFASQRDTIMATQQLVDVLEKSREEDVVEDSLVEPMLSSQSVKLILSEGIEENKRGMRNRKVQSENEPHEAKNVTNQMSTRTRRRKVNDEEENTVEKTKKEQAPPQTTTRTRRRKKNVDDERENKAGTSRTKKDEEEENKEVVQVSSSKKKVDKEETQTKARTRRTKKDEEKENKEEEKLQKLDGGQTSGLKKKEETPKSEKRPFTPSKIDSDDDDFEAKVPFASTPKPISAAPTKRSSRRTKLATVEESASTPPISEEPAKKSRRLSANSRQLKNEETKTKQEPAPETPDRNRRQLKPKVVFTMMDDPNLEALIRHLGGHVVDTVDACTVLVTESIKRSHKLLCAVGQGKPICSPQWLHACKKAYAFVDPWDYVLEDAEAETKWSFSLRESLNRSSRTKLLENHTFQVIVDAAADVLKGAIEACGGKCVTRNLAKADTDHILIVSTPKNSGKFGKIVKQNPKILVVEPEAIFDGTLRQEFRFKDFLLN